VRILHEHPELGLTRGAPCDPDLLSYAYPPKFGVYAKSFVEWAQIDRWTKGEARYRVQLAHEVPGLTEGARFRSHALPSVQQPFQR